MRKDFKFHILNSDIYHDGSIRYVDGYIDGLPTDLSKDELETIYASMIATWKTSVDSNNDDDHVFASFDTFEHLPIRIRPSENGIIKIQIDVCKRAGVKAKNSIDGFVGVNPIKSYICDYSFNISIIIPERENN